MTMNNDIFRLSDGTTTIDLMYDSSGSGYQAIASGIKFGISEHQHIYHRSEYADGEMVAREKLANKRWGAKIAIKANSDDDNISNELIALNRLAKQARKYQIDNSEDKVYLEVQLDSATNWTRYDVVDLEFSELDLFDFYNRHSGDVKFGEAFSFETVTKPYGYGNEVTLANEIRTPHFERDGNSDGLADNWTALGGCTTSLDTSTYLIGTQSQKIVTATTTSNEGIKSDAITISGADTITGYAWIYKSAGDDITVDIQADKSGSLGTATYNAATVTASGAGGNTWKRCDVANVNTTAGDSELNVYIRRLSGTTTTTFYIDKCYLQLNQSSVPSGWMSSRYITNRQDNTAGHINYIDVADVPGDANTELHWVLHKTCDTGGDNYIYLIGSNADDAFKYQHVFEAEDATSDQGTWASQSDADSSDGEYSQCTNGYLGTTVANFTLANLDQSTLTGYRRCFIMARVADTATTGAVKVQLGANANFNYATDAVGLDVAVNQWDLYDTGTIYVPKTAKLDSLNTSAGQVAGTFTLASATSTTDIDFVYLIPQNSCFIIQADSTGGQGTDDIIYLDENEECIYFDDLTSSYHVNTDFVGALPEYDPSTNNRYYVVGTGMISSYPTYLDSDYKTTVSFRPRTEFLLGTT